MKKYYCKLLIFFTSFQLLFCQEDFKSQIDWKKIEFISSDSMKINYLKKVKSNDYVNLEGLWDDKHSLNKENYLSFLYEELSKVHLLDINNDSLIDIIYEGRIPVGIELNDVVIFINKGDSIEVALKAIGEFEEININNNTLDSMVLVVYPCCANFISTRVKYSFVNETNGKLCVSDEIGEFSNGYAQYFTEILPCYLTELEAFDYFYTSDEKIVNKSFISKRNFYLTFDPGELTNKEIIENVDISYLIFGYNQVGFFKKGTLGIVQSITKKKGVKYALVKINNSNKIQSIFKEDDIIIYGWTKLSNIQFVDK